MRRSALIITVFIILLVDVWVFAGIFRDKAFAFRYLNYFGYFLPLLALVSMAATLLLARSWWIRVVSLLLVIPAITLPYVLPSAEATGERWSWKPDGTPVTEFDFVTFSKTGHNREYDRIREIADCSKHDVIVMQEFEDFQDFAAAQPEAVKDCNVAVIREAWNSAVIMSRFPVHGGKLTDAGTQAWVTIDGTDVLVLTRRFDRSMKSRGAALQKQQIENVVQQLGDVNPVILAGDFNSTLHNESVYRLRREFAYADPGGFPVPAATFPAEKRWYSFVGALLRIDHIFYRGLGVLQSEVLAESYGSDHFPVRAVFAIPHMERENEQP